MALPERGLSGRIFPEFFPFWKGSVETPSGKNGKMGWKDVWKALKDFWKALWDHFWKDGGQNCWKDWKDFWKEIWKDVWKGFISDVVIFCAESNEMSYFWRF